MKKVDPRTLLPIVAVPSRLASFLSLDNAVIHWIGPVKKVASTSREQTRIAIVGDAAVYQCDEDATIRRCLVIHELQDLIVKDQDDCIGFRTSAKGEYDMLLRFGKDKALVLSYVLKIYLVHMGKELRVVQMASGDPLQPHLRLDKPSSWTLRIEPLRPQSFLEKLLTDHTVSKNRTLERIQEEFIRLKNELRAEMEATRNDQYDRMVVQLVRYTQQVAKKDSVICALMDALDSAKPFILDSQVVASIGALLRSVSRPEQMNADGSVSVTGAPMIFKTMNPSEMMPGGSSGGGAFTGIAAVDSGACPRCAEYRKLLEAHPTVDKRRIVAAEEALSAATKQLDALRRRIAPDREEIKTLRDVINSVDVVLRDQRRPLQQRIRVAIGATAPFAQGPKTPHGEDVASVAARKARGFEEPSDADGVPMSVDPSGDVSALVREVLTLRGVLRDASALHMGELHKLRQEFDAYHEAMIHAVRERLEEFAATAGQAKSLSTRLVESARAAATTYSSSSAVVPTGMESTPERQRMAADSSGRTLSALSPLFPPSATNRNGSGDMVARSSLERGPTVSVGDGSTMRVVPAQRSYGDLGAPSASPISKDWSVAASSGATRDNYGRATTGGGAPLSARPAATSSMPNGFWNESAVNGNDGPLSFVVDGTTSRGTTRGGGAVSAVRWA